MKTSMDIEMLPPGSRIAGQLRDHIRRGRFKLGDRLPDERKLAEKFSVSRRTIREAMNLLEKDRLILRHQGRGTFVADPAITGPVRGGTALVGMMVYEREYYFEKVIQGASVHAARKGYALATGSNATDAEESEHVQAYLRNAVLGVVLAPRSEASRANYERLIERRVPVVFLDTFIAGVDEDYVVVDNAKGTALATRHLVELGHRRIGYLGHNRMEDLPCRPERRRGFRETCEELGLSVDPQWVLEADQSMNPEGILRVLKSPDRPTAFVTYNDSLAVAAVQAARSCGLKVPEDLSVVGFDDSSLAGGFDVPLTSVNPEHRQIGISAVNLLLEKIDEGPARVKRGIHINPRLEVRQSTASAPKD